MEACKWAGKAATQVRAVVIFSFIYHASPLKKVNHYSSTHSLVDFWREKEFVFLGIFGYFVTVFNAVSSPHVIDNETKLYFFSIIIFISVVFCKNRLILLTSILFISLHFHSLSISLFLFFFCTLIPSSPDCSLYFPFLVQSVYQANKSESSFCLERHKMDESWSLDAVSQKFHQTNEPETDEETSQFILVLPPSSFS